MDEMYSSSAILKLKSTTLDFFFLFLLISFPFVLNHLGPVVQSPISANPGLTP